MNPTISLIGATNRNDKVLFHSHAFATASRQIQTSINSFQASSHVLLRMLAQLTEIPAAFRWTDASSNHVRVEHVQVQFKCRSAVWANSNICHVTIVPSIYCSAQGAESPASTASFATGVGNVHTHVNTSDLLHVRTSHQQMNALKHSLFSKKYVLVSASMCSLCIQSCTPTTRFNTMVIPYPRQRIYLGLVLNSWFREGPS